MSKVTKVTESQTQTFPMDDVKYFKGTEMDGSSCNMTEDDLTLCLEPPKIIHCAITNGIRTTHFGKQTQPLPPKASCQCYPSQELCPNISATDSPAPTPLTPMWHFPCKDFRMCRSNSS